MTTLILAPAMSLHGDVDRAAATWVGLVDAHDAVRRPDRVLLESGELFDRARLLVRDRGSVRGYVTLPVTDGTLEAAALADAVESLAMVPPASRPAPRPI